MKCSVVKGLMSSYLDGEVTRSQMAQADEHLQGCVECAARYASMRQTQVLVGSLGRRTAPPELALRLRVAVSQELISFLYPSQMTAANDVPTMLYTPAELRFTPFELSMGAGSADSLVVEAYV